MDAEKFSVNRTHIALLGLLLTSQLGNAGPFEDGSSAMKARDFHGALAAWRPLAERGDSRAQRELADFYYDGQGVAQDYAKAAKWYRLAADQEDAFAQYQLGLMHARGEGVPQNFDEANNPAEASRYLRALNKGRVVEDAIAAPLRKLIGIMTSRHAEMTHAPDRL